MLGIYRFPDVSHETSSKIEVILHFKVKLSAAEYHFTTYHCKQVQLLGYIYNITLLYATSYRKSGMEPATYSTIFILLILWGYFRYYVKASKK